MRTKPCSATVAQERMNKANQFITAAETIRDFANEDDEVADAYVTLCVLQDELRLRNSPPRFVAAGHVAECPAKTPAVVTGS